MDLVTAHDRAPRVRFGPDRRLTAVAALAAIVSAALCIGADPLGRVLFGIAAVVLAGYAIGDLVWWPRLAADAAGVRVRTPFTRADLRWEAIDSIHADVRTRYGLRSTTLEVDAGELLVVFSRRSLGADPATVAGLLAAMRP